MIGGAESYEVYALRYGSTSQRKSTKYHRYFSYDEPDEVVGLDFYFWLIRNGQRTVLLDCGFDAERGRARNHVQSRHPLELLSTLDVTASEIDHVILSHMHFDHIGNVGLFPNATFTVAQAEFDYWTGPFNDRRFLAEAGDPDETAMIVELAKDGRVRFIGDAEDLFPGIRATATRGHSPGQLITEVRTESADVVLASDAVHFYEELERDRPYWRFHDLEGMYHGFERLRALGSAASIVAGHDPRVMTMFAPVSDDCVDLTDPLR